MKRPLLWLALICVGAFVFRLALLPMAQHPGIGDPTHYYNLGLRLLDGHGFTIDYIWHFNHLHNSIVHPDDHWLPLTGIVAAIGMSVFGASPSASLIGFIILGSLLCLVGYAGARLLGCEETTSLFSAAFIAVLPEFVANSLLSDTIVPNALFVSGSLLAFIHGMRTGMYGSFALSGLLAGLGYLTRNDTILLLPILMLVVLLYRRHAIRAVMCTLPVALLMITPWLARNLNELGYLSPSETRVMFFFTDNRDHYSYDRVFSFETMLSQKSVGELIGKRLFELAAAAKLMVTSLDIVLPLAVAGGLVLMLAKRDPERMRIIIPIVLFVIGTVIFYAVFVPFKAQSGSLKKAYLSLVPLLIPIGAYAVQQAIPNMRMRTGAVVITVALMSMNAFELVRNQNNATNTFVSTMQRVVTVLETLPDTNGDDTLIVMTQDPFVLRYLGYQGVQIPFENRDKIAEVAERYGVDYLLTPSARPAIEALENGSEQDDRFVPVATIPQTSMQFWRIDQMP